MRQGRCIAIALGASLAAAAPLASGATAPPVSAPARTLAVIPFYAPERMWVLYSPLVEFLARATGTPWQLKVHANHQTLIDDICAGRVDVALLGPVPLARANARCGAIPFLVAVGADGAPSYRSILLTTDPSVRSVAALRGRAVGFFKGSTAAHVLPVEMLAEAGLPPGSYQEVFLASQDRLMGALMSRRIAAAGVKSALYARFERERGLRKLVSSRPVPNFAFVALPTLEPAVRARFEASLLDLRPGSRRADAAVVKGWDDELRNGFVRPASDFLRQVLALKDATERVLHDGD